MNRSLRWTLVMLVACSTVAIGATSALAACHAFAFGQTAYSVNEGAGKVTITVRRDAAINPSSVKIRTANIEAIGNEDYTPVERTVDFPTGTEVPVDIPIANDSNDEPDERFRVEFVPGSGSGCQVNQNFTYGNPTTVTIQDNDEPAVVAAPSPSPRPSPSPSPTKSPSPSPSPEEEVEESPSPDAEESPTPEVVTTQAADEGDGGGLPGGVIIAIAAAIVAGGAGSGLLYLRRRGATPPTE